MKWIYLWAISTASAVMAVSPARAEPFTQIIDFGDSLSDVGNVHALTTFAHGVDPSSYPIVPGAPGYYDGRFSNGSIWVDQLASLLMLPAPSVTFGNPAGTDYAYGDATSGGGNTQTFIPNIQTQISNFTSAHAAGSTQLFTIWGGANDLLDALDSSETSVQQTTDAQQAAINITAGVRSLYNDGATNVLVLNLPDLGLTPRFRGDSQQSQASALAAAFDAALAVQLSQLTTTSPGLNLHTLDVFTLFHELINDPSAYGLSNVTDPAYTGDPNFLGNGTSVADPTGYLFWDEDHPTTIGHGLIAQTAYSVLVPEPTCLTVVLAGLIALRRRPLGQ